MTHVDHYVVAGNPVAHSQSPFIHAMFARATGQAMRYGRLLCPIDAEGGFARDIRAFAASIGGAVGDFDTAAARSVNDVERASGAPDSGPARGCNVTVPFKFEAYQLGARRTERASLAQAANVLRFDPPGDGGWLADNTDGAGLVRDIERNAGVSLTNLRVLLIGAGGAAAGALGPLIAAKPAALVLCNRTHDRAEALAARHASWSRAHGVPLSVGTLQRPGTAFDVVINASASSLQASAPPVPAAVLRDGALALDMMYGAAARPFIAWAEAHGARGRDGLGMLVEQAAEAFFVWRGVRPETAPVRAALQQRLAGATRART
ncbi:MAG: shikimate dehydrogenase [Burkholderiaceae bacterium]|nr:shikimate dehydrogenase [Burkholderiaceae bacterium]